MRARAGIGVLVLIAAIAIPAAQAEASSYCSPLPGVTTFRWTGHAGNGLFSDAENWRPHQIPGLATDTPTAYACIPSTADVSLRAGEEADLQALDSRGTLHLEPGSKLFVGSRTGNAGAPDSNATNLDIVGATLGGTATLNVTGTLEWTSVPPDAASTQTTRALEQISGGPPAFVGRTVIATGAAMNIDGGTSADGGVNLRDDRALDVYGTVTTTNGGFLAADWGTALRLLVNGTKAGRFVFENDGGIYQGFTNVDLPWETDRATVLNTGKIVKQPGSVPGSSEGTSVIDADYSNADGTGHTGGTNVVSGTLTIFGPSASASVQSGAAIGFGGCPDATAICAQPTTDASDPQLATFQLASGSSAVSVALAAPPATNPYNRVPVGDPVAVTTPNRAAASKLTLRVDHSVTGGATLAQMTVGRGGHVLPSCNTSGPPCLLDKHVASDDSGDYILVVSTRTGGMFSPLGPRFR